ncbi:hypothetical protein BDN70DRAFT_840772 [Pholiota conissans]|uniref:Metallothionein n=1 Tax=Pholiota conissans TaxID=109636 RepID=A0A9P5YTP0_9AGAR|nr:hypothetical protein BDN70DRAFT_840772 [Pholiota conissans]
MQMTQNVLVSQSTSGCTCTPCKCGPSCTCGTPVSQSSSGCGNSACTCTSCNCKPGECNCGH